MCKVEYDLKYCLIHLRSILFENTFNEQNKPRTKFRLNIRDQSDTSNRQSLNPSRFLIKK